MEFLKLSNDMYVGFCARRDYVDKLKAEMEELKAEVVNGSEPTGGNDET